ncbi:TPA: hypothetical protein ACOXDE_003156 [Escherichia coli]
MSAWFAGVCGGYPSLVLWCCGAVVLWCCGAVVLVVVLRSLV